MSKAPDKNPTPRRGAQNGERQRNPSQKELERLAQEATLAAWQATYDNARAGRRLDRPDRQRKGKNRLDRNA